MKHDWIWVGVGSALGGISRYYVSLHTARWFGTAFPYGTLLVNVTGCFLIGALAAFAEGDAPLLRHPDAARFLIAGCLGGYTTFSAFSLQTLELARAGQGTLALLNVAGSVILCLLAVWLGHLTGQSLAR